MNRLISSFFFTLILSVSLYSADRKPANINASDFIDESALHDAVRSKELVIIRSLVERGANINAKDQYDFTPLHLAVRNKDINTTKYLIEQKATVDTFDSYGDTPLVDAVRNNDTNISKLLLCKKARRDVVDRNDISLLNYAAKNQNLYLTKLLTVDYVELYCQDSLGVSIDKFENITQNTSPKICGKFEGYAADTNLTIVSDDNTTFGPYQTKIDNKTHTWCVTIKDILPKNRYDIDVTAVDYVVNTANAKSEIFISSPIEIEIDKYEKAISAVSPKVCGSIKNAYAKNIDLNITSANDENIKYGPFSALIDNKNKRWCSDINTSVEEGEYLADAQALDISGNSFNAKGKFFIKTTLGVAIDKVEIFNDNTPKICGTLIKGDITKVELSLKNEENSFGPYGAKIDKENKTWCADVVDELPNGDYTLIADASNEKGGEGSAEELTKIYRITGLYEALYEEFENDFSTWNAELDKDTMTFRFKDPTMLFNPGRSNINNKFETILSDFFPRYVKIVEEYKNQIEKVRIEGHSSSEHSKANNDEERFELNRVLSQNRAESVMEYAKALSDESVVQNIAWIGNTFEPIGMSYSKLVLNLDGSENKELSRRVEFRIITKHIDDIKAADEAVVEPELPQEALETNEPQLGEAINEDTLLDESEPMTQEIKLDDTPVEMNEPLLEESAGEEPAIEDAMLQELIELEQQAGE